ncbi:MAG: group II intron maturase-specific domain-containing protein [Akkermansia sp.]
MEKLKTRVRLITHRGRPFTLKEVITKPLSVLRGRGNYFRLAVIKKLGQTTDEWIRLRLRWRRRWSNDCSQPSHIAHG